MRLEKWALVAEVVSGIAIVVTLVVLIFQIRQGTAAVRASTYQDVVDSITTTLHERAFDEDVARLWYTADAGEVLEGLDAERFNALAIANMRRFENAYYQYLIGGIEPSQWDGIRRALGTVVTTPGHRRWWPERRALFSEDFQMLVDDILDTD
jgi:hypothetical protein